MSTTEIGKPEYPKRMLVNRSIICHTDCTVYQSGVTPVVYVFPAFFQLAFLKYQSKFGWEIEGHPKDGFWDNVVWIPKIKKWRPVDFPLVPKSKLEEAKN